MPVPARVLCASRERLRRYEEKCRLLAEEKAKHRKAAEVEVKRLKMEVKASMRSFDEGLGALFEERLHVQAYVEAQELYAVRLAASVQARVDGIVREHLLEVRIAELRAGEEAAEGAVEAFRARVEEANAELSAATLGDKELRDNFKAALQEAAGRELDGDTLRMAAAVFKKRRMVDGGAGGAGSRRAPNRPSNVRHSGNPERSGAAAAPAAVRIAAAAPAAAAVASVKPSAAVRGGGGLGDAAPGTEVSPLDPFGDADRCARARCAESV